MWVYGDRTRRADPRRVLAELRDQLAALEAPDLPIERHARLAALFIAAAELAQGLADAAMAAQGGDGPTSEQDAAMAVVTALAKALLASWSALGEDEPGPAPPRVKVGACLDVLERLPLIANVQLKTGEGHAFYALYPEAYAGAAALLEPARDMVIGVRSIGLGLAAVAAAALGAGAPVTVRPVGHPFQRRLSLTPALKARLKAAVGARFVVVDEGPGLSGSSFGAVADALEALGAPPGDIAFLPGHGGEPGPQASPAHRARWSTARRACVAFDALVVGAERPGQRLKSWFADLDESGTGALHDLSGGAWRAVRYACEAEWPAVNTHQERRKFLLTSAQGTWLLKFAGLGAAGERAFAQARALADAGFAPEATALRYGFLAQPWLQPARRLRLDPDHRHAFAAHLGRYLGWRAAHLSAPDDAGADMGALREMARLNVSEALGAAAGAAAAFDPRRWADAPPIRRVWTDNRLHAHEWLQLKDDRWLKTDAVDHAAAHDLIGAQDIAWDVAGARVEFQLDEGEMQRLLDALATPIEPVLIDLLEPAYLAYQLGAFETAAQAHIDWPQEQRRLTRGADVYRRRLQAGLQA